MAELQLALDVEHFLQEHWQRRHVYLPGGAVDFQPPANADELAGLAMEPEVDSRIIYRDGGRWQQQQGPFDETAFQRSGAWALLVQSVDHYWDAARELHALVHWLPGWRLDDVLMSYACDGGSAAPHVDNYDVFIIQGEGQRRWQIGGFCEQASTPSADASPAILEDFHSESEYLMQTGDVLYIPPGCAHYGVSLGESTSFSIGFRAPRISDLLAQYADHTLATMDQQRLFQDQKRARSHQPGEIDSADVERAREQLLDCLDSTDARWFGEAVTRPAGDQEMVGPEGNVDLKALAGQTTLRKTPGSQIAWCASADSITVFANGNSRQADTVLRALVTTLCSGAEVAVEDAQSQHENALTLMQWLVEEGALELCD